MNGLQIFYKITEKGKGVPDFEGENGLLFSRNGKSCGMNISLTMNLLLDMGMYFEAGIQYIHNFIFFSRRERKKQGRRDERF